MNKTQFNEFNDDVKKMFAVKAQRLLERFLEFVDLIEDAESDDEFKILEKEFLNIFELCYRDEFGDPDYDDCYVDLASLVQAMTVEVEKLFEHFNEYYDKKYEKSKNFKLNKEKLYLKIKEFYIPKIIKCLVEEYELKLEYFNFHLFSNDELKKFINK